MGGVVISADADPADLDRRVVALLLGVLRSDHVAVDNLLGRDADELRVLTLWLAVWTTTTLSRELGGAVPLAARLMDWQTGAAL